MVLPSRDTTDELNSTGGDSNGANAVGDVTTNELPFAEMSIFTALGK